MICLSACVRFFALYQLYLSSLPTSCLPTHVHRAVMPSVILLSLHFFLLPVLLSESFQWVAMRWPVSALASFLLKATPRPLSSSASLPFKKGTLKSLSVCHCLVLISSLALFRLNSLCCQIEWKDELSFRLCLRSLRFSKIERFTLGCKEQFGSWVRRLVE